MIIECVNSGQTGNPFLVLNKTVNGVSSPLCVLNDRTNVEYTEELMVFQYGDKNEKLYFSLNSPRRKDLRDKLSLTQRLGTFFILGKNDEYIGRIYREVYKPKGHKLLSYHLIKFEYGDKIYDVFEVGFGNKDGQYLCVYRENSLVAVAQKNFPKDYGQSVYTIYSSDDTADELGYLSAYWHFSDLHSATDFSGSDISRSTMLTPFKEIMEKYDDSFISRVKEKDEEMI